MIVESDSQRYLVGDRVADFGAYRLYLCKQENTGRQCLFQIAADIGRNGLLDRAAYLLTELKRSSDELEEEYALVRKDPKVLLNYDLGFPELVDSFICHGQGGRRVNILAFRNVEDVGRMVPIRNITEKDHRRVDLRTSAWIMGKTLKLLEFAHSQGITVGRVDGANILIEPDEHYVVLFDWSDAHTHADTIPRKTTSNEIAQAAQAIITVLGGDFKTRSFPNDGEETFVRYTDHLLRLADGSQHTAETAHEEFYELIDGLWRREFYPFTFHTLTH